jgi:phage/plasmid-like protein (TIGR03299 family)
MAHRLSIRNGKVEMAYTGQTPWHGLGEKVDHFQTVAEAFARTLPWTVSLREISYAGYAGGMIPSKANTRIIARDDDDTQLGVATVSYMPVQNAQAGEIVEALVAEGAQCIETIGALDDGARCFTLVNLDKTGFEARPGDTVKPYFVLAWGHDGRHPVAGDLTTVRVVCHNTLTAAGFGDSGAWRKPIHFKHTASAKLRLDEAREALKLARKALATTREQYSTLAAARIAPQAALDYFGQAFQAPVQGTSLQFTGDSRITLIAPKDADQKAVEAIDKWDAVQRRLVSLYAGEGKGANIAGPTAWGAYNAITEYLDHVYPVTSNGTVSTTRQQSVLFGTYADVRTSAYDAALALV